MYRKRVALLILVLVILGSLGFVFGQLIGDYAGITAISPSPVSTKQDMIIGVDMKCSMGIADYYIDSSIDGSLVSRTNLNAYNITTNETVEAGTLNSGQHIITITTGCLSPIGAPIKMIRHSKTINVTEPPVATISYVSPNGTVKLGTKIVFEGYGTDPDAEAGAGVPGRIITGYSWTSNLDGNLSDKSNFSTAGLSAGSQIISFRVHDDQGIWSEPDTVQINVKMRDLEEENIQIIPRFSSAGVVSYLVGVPPRYPNYACYAEDSKGGQSNCIDFAEEMGDCTDTFGNTAPILKFSFSKPEDYKFTVSNLEGSNKVGNISIVSPSGFGVGSAHDYGALKAEDFIPSGYYMSLGLSSEIRPQDGWVQYQLYRLKNCRLVKVGGAVDFQARGSRYDSYDSYLQKPTDCKEASCEYLGEVIMLKGTRVGGALFKFTYQPEMNFTVEAKPAVVALGSVSLGETASSNATIKNTASVKLTGLTADIDDPALFFDFDKTSIGPGETAKLKIRLDVPQNTSMGVHTAKANLHSAESGNLSIASISVSYTITPSVNITILPASWVLGDIAAGSNVTKTFMINYTNGNVYTVTVNVVPSGEIANSVVLEPFMTDVALGRGEEIKASFIAPPNTTDIYGELQFVVSYDGAVAMTEIVTVTGSVSTQADDLLSDVRARLTQAISRLDNLEAQVLLDSDIYEMVESDLADASDHLNTAGGKISEAETALNAGDRSTAEALATEASAEISSAELVMSGIQQTISPEQQETAGKMSPLIWVLVAVGAFGGFILALREGWIPEEKVPWLFNGFRKIGLGALVSPATQMVAQPRFANSAIAGAMAGQAPATTVKPQASNLAQQQAQYYRQNQYYGNYRANQQRYANAYNRRYH